jgi:hypothetical protein
MKDLVREIICLCWPMWLGFKVLLSRAQPKNAIVTPPKLENDCQHCNPLGISSCPAGCDLAGCMQNKNGNVLKIFALALHMKIILSLCSPRHTHFPLTQWHAHQK